MICPIMSGPTIQNGWVKQSEVECIGSRCMLWVEKAREEGVPLGACGLVPLANPAWIPDPAHEEASE